MITYTLADERSGKVTILADRTPSEISLFGKVINIKYTLLDMPTKNQFAHQCEAEQFYLEIPEVARFLAIPAENCIYIEKNNPSISFDILKTWLHGTVMGYMLQHAGDLVLHGSAILMNNKAVIISGHSGAGKSTLAAALFRAGYPLITDDLVVIRRNPQGQYGIIPGPSQVKLWKDALHHLAYPHEEAKPVMLKMDKYSIPIKQTVTYAHIPVQAFYELNPQESAQAFSCMSLNDLESLQTLMRNAYRYFMLKPLGKLETFFQGCAVLAKQIQVNQLIRGPQFSDLAKIVQYLEGAC